MLPFFDFMVWPGTLGQVLRMRIRHVVLRGKGVFFVVILVWPRRKIRGVGLCKNKSHVYSFSSSFLLLYCMYSIMLYKSGISSFDLSIYTALRPAGALWNIL